MEYETHEGEQYLVINPQEYVKHRTDQCFVGSKFSSITARKGYVGEKIKTIMKNGLTETVNVVTYDAETGEPDWVVTQESGEQMIVTDKKFKSLYQTEPVAEGEVIKPSGKYRPMVFVDENVCLKTSWGEMQYIKKGGVLVTLSSDDIYGIQETEFFGSYTVIYDVDGTQMLEENLSKTADTKKMPTVFLSVAYPYDSKEDQAFMKEVIQYVNSKGIKAINVKKIEESNINLVNEIINCLQKCDGVLSLAFNKGENRTSPFIQIETALAQSLNLTNLMIVPDSVKKEGMLFSDNVDGKIQIIGYGKSLFDESNSHIRKALDELCEEIASRYSFQIEKSDLAQFRSGLFDTEKVDETKNNIVQFLKNFYKVDEDINLNNIFVKRPTKIKAVIIEEDGDYETKNGTTKLKKGDFLITDIDGKVYSVGKKEFEMRYMKANGEENTYVSKLIPTIAHKKGDNVEVCAMSDMADKYEMSKERFAMGYQSLQDYIIDLTLTNDNKNIRQF